MVAEILVIWISVWIRSYGFFQFTIVTNCEKKTCFLWQWLTCAHLYEVHKTFLFVVMVSFKISYRSIVRKTMFLSLAGYLVPTCIKKTYWIHNVIFCGIVSLASRLNYQLSGNRLKLMKFYWSVKLLKLGYSLIAATQFLFKRTNYDVQFFIIFHQVRKIMEHDSENSWVFEQWTPGGHYT